MDTSAYYTNAQARKVLGNISTSTLKSYVESGIIDKCIPPGKKYGLYPKTQVDALAEANKSFEQGPSVTRERLKEDGRNYSAIAYCT